MDKNTLSTISVIGIAAVIVVAAMAMDMNVTGKAVAIGPYKCTGDWPDRVLNTADKTIEWNCPGDRPYCDEYAAIAGTPRCCAIRQGVADGYVYDYCEAVGTDIHLRP